MPFTLRKTNPIPHDDQLHFEALGMLAKSDRVLALMDDIGVTEPHLPDDITADFVGGIIGSAVPGARLEDMTTTASHSGMTDRRKWTLHWNAAGQAAGLPESAFIKATPHLPAHREMLSVLHMDEAEVKLYRQIAPDIPDVTPHCHYARSYGGGRSLILLEDLEARGCKVYWQGYDCTIAHAYAVASAQAVYHSRYWQSERLLSDLSWVRPRTQRYGWPWLCDSHDEARTTFLTDPTEEEVPADVVPVLQMWHENCDRVYRHWDTLPRTLLHGDSHLGNTFEKPDGSAGYYDWQVLYAGHGLRDLSYFLMSALTNEQRTAHERPIFEHYLDAMADRGVKLDRQEAWDIYTLMAFDRWDATLVAYVHATYNHSREGQLRMFRTIAGAVRDHDVGGRLESLLKKID